MFGLLLERASAGGGPQPRDCLRRARPLSRVWAERSSADMLPGRSVRRKASSARASVQREGRLLKRRERRRDQHLVFLADGTDTGLRRPLTALARFFPNPRALAGVLVRPHVHEL